MNKTKLYGAIAAVIGVAAVPATASAAITSISAVSGVYDCAGGFGTYPVCSYGTDVVSGSFFSMDGNGDGTVQTGEKVAINVVADYNFYDTTAATGSHTGAINGTESPVSDIWEFFGNTGMSHLTSPMADNGDGTIDMTGWGVTWNTIPNIPMGGDPTNFPADTGLANIACGACNVTDAYTLTYDAHVPLNDPSTFGGVAYNLNLIGTIATVGAVPVPAAVWLFGSGLLGLVGVARRKKQA